jgi:hypothetical protein
MVAAGTMQLTYAVDHCGASRRAVELFLAAVDHVLILQVRETPSPSPLHVPHVNTGIIIILVYCYVFVSLFRGELVPLVEAG